MRRNMNLQLFAEPEEGGTGPEGNGNQQQNQQPQAPQFDYDKLASLISGKQTVTEESVLKGYFKQQGLSKEQMDQAIAAFKQQQAANTPDVGAIQTQLTQAQSALQQSKIENAAILQAIGLGIEAKNVPYVLKMADLSHVVREDGKLNEETLKSALNKVLEDVPALKTQAPGTTGFRLGASGSGSPQSGTEDELDKIFGVKKG